MLNKYFTRSLVLLVAFLLLNQYSGAQNCWSAVGGGIDTSNTDHVAAMTEYKGNLIVAGVFKTAGGNVPASNIASWNGSTWLALGSGLNTVTPAESYAGSVNALAVYNGDLYVAGTFDTAGGIPVKGLAKWDGTSWSAVGTPAFNLSSQINAMAVYNGSLYLGGYFDTITGVGPGLIIKWDGTSFTSVSGGLQGLGGIVEALTPYNGKLYAGGLFALAGGLQSQNIAVWNDTVWLAMGNGLKTACGCGGVNAIVVNQGIIYANLEAEDTGSSYAIEQIAGWNGTTWTYLVGNPDSAFTYGDVATICVYNGNLVAAGNLITIGGDSIINIAQWNGTNWLPMGAGIGNIYTSIVGVLDTAFGQLYAAGSFTQAGNVAALNIAEYACTTSGINDVVASVTVKLYPNPSTGIFNIAAESLYNQSAVTIYNLLGQPVLTGNLQAGKTEFNLTGAPAGVYLYRISGADGQSEASGSFIIQ